jgi:hypothetical protein
MRTVGEWGVDDEVGDHVDGRTAEIDVRASMTAQAGVVVRSNDEIVIAVAIQVAHRGDRDPERVAVVLSSRISDEVKRDGGTHL